MGEGGRVRRTSARPHDRATARPHVRTTARPHVRTSVGAVWEKGRGGPGDHVQNGAQWAATLLTSLNLQAKKEEALVAFLSSHGASHGPLKMFRFMSKPPDPSEIEAQPLAACGSYGRGLPLPLPHSWHQARRVQVHLGSLLRLLFSMPISASEFDYFWRPFDANNSKHSCQNKQKCLPESIQK